MSMEQLDSQEKYVSFLLNNEFYAVKVGQVKEVFVPDTITPIPQAEAYVAGVINYRGLVISVIDLKRRLLIEGNEEDADHENKNYVLIIERENSTVGLLVDYVEAVIVLDQTNIQKEVEMVSLVSDSNFVEGIGKSDDDLVIIVNLNLIFEEDVEKYASSTESNPQTQKLKGDTSEDSLGGMLNLSELTKEELLKLATEMGIKDLNSQSEKKVITDKLNQAVNQ